MSSRGSKKLHKRVAKQSHALQVSSQAYQLALTERNIFMALLIEVIENQPNKSIELIGSPEDIYKKHNGVKVLNSNFDSETKHILLSTSDKVVVDEKSSNTNPVIPHK